MPHWFLKKIRPEAASFLRFCLIGLANTTLHFCVLSLFVELLGFPKPQANVLGFLVANVFSYCVNSLWNFKAQLKVAGYVRFFATSVTGCLISYAAMSLGEAAGWYYRLTFLTQLPFVSLVNFTLLRLFVFPCRDGTQKTAPP